MTRQHEHEKHKNVPQATKPCNFCVQGNTAVLLKSPLLKTFSIVGGLLWTIVYIHAMYLGWRDKSFAIPTFALCMNISWEFLMSFVYPHPKAFIRNRNIVWFLFDVVLLYQTFVNGTLYEFSSMPFVQQYFPYILAAALALTFTGVYLFMSVTKDHAFGIITATVISVVMSALFLCMFFGRGGSRGQSLLIAVCKNVGSELMFVNQYYMGYNHPFYLYAYAVVAILDWSYIYCLLAL